MTRVPAPGQLDPATLEDACGDEPGGVCEAVWNATHNEALSRVADWLIGRPLRVVVIVLAAWLVARVARRAVRKVVVRLVVTDRDLAGRALTKVGVKAALPEEDPRRTGRARSVSGVLASTVTIAVWIVAVFLIAGELGFNLAPLLASAGIAGVALGFGAQSLVKDCITGLFMLIEDQYGVGDQVDVGEASGTVERISLRTTVLRGVDGTVWHVPNGEIRRVGNRSQQYSVAVVDIAVGPEADLRQASVVIETTMRAVCEDPEHREDVLEDPRLLGVESVTAEGVSYRVLVRTRPGAQYRLQRALREAIKRDLVAAGVPNPRGPAWTEGGTRSAGEGMP